MLQAGESQIVSKLSRKAARAVFPVAIAAGLGLMSGVATASCAGPVPMREAIETSRATFVGTVSDLENYRRWATVDVLETWKGTVPTEQVMVKAGPKDPPGRSRVASSIERTYRLGETYLFVVYGGSGSVYRDSNCSRTTSFDERLERFRPASATSESPTPSGTTAGDDAGESLQEGGGAAVVVALLAAATGAGLLLWVRGRRPPVG